MWGRSNKPKPAIIHQKTKYLPSPDILRISTKQATCDMPENQTFFML
jgi:hypothetical protein